MEKNEKRPNNTWNIISEAKIGIREIKSMLLPEGMNLTLIVQTVQIVQIIAFVDGEVD